MTATSGLLRPSGVGKFQHVAGAQSTAVSPFQGGEQSGWLDLALGQALRNRAAVVDELGLPGDAVLAVRQFAPSRI